MKLCGDCEYYGFDECPCVGIIDSNDSICDKFKNRIKPATSEWLPIEEAPKDGSKGDLFCWLHYSPTIIRYGANGWTDSEGRVVHPTHFAYIYPPEVKE